MKTVLKLLAAGTAAVMVAVLSVAGSEAPSASAAQADYYLKIDGIEGEIQIESFSWGITTPRDAASGQATGKRQHKPLTITKPIDKSSPLLFRLANDGKTPKTSQVSLIKRSTEGGAPYTVTFFDVFITEFAQAGDIGSQGSESISFTYQKIEYK
jgi:type VI secretion system secreted protein Hcp